MKTMTRWMVLAAAAMAILHGTENVASAQYNAAQYQALANAQAAARRDAIVRAERIELLRRQAAQALLAQEAQRAAQRQTLLSEIARQQTIRRNAQILLLAILASRQQASRVNAVAAGGGQQAPLFNGTDSPQQLIAKLNAMSSADVKALMSKPNFLDQFTPYWMKNAPGGNVLAQFGVGNGLMKELGTRDLNKILDSRRLDAIQPKLKQAQILGNIAAGQAAQNKVYHDVQKNQNILLADKDRSEAMRQLIELLNRAGVSLEAEAIK